LPQPRQLLFLVLLAVLGSSFSSACTPQMYVALMPGVVNNPANRTLRREILAFGTGTLCKELMKRSVPLKLREDDPTLGRFFPRQCKIESLENGDLYVQFAGIGYAWSNLTKRMSFTASAAIQYEQDFRLDGSTMYVYFKPAATTARKFELTMVEQPVMPTTPVTPLFPGGDAKTFMNQIGEGMLAREIGRGFTVIREDDGSASFGVGLIPIGERPTAPYERKDDDRLLYVNESIEVHQNQRDYVGPLEVPEDDMALYLTLSVTGAPAVDVIVVPKQQGDAWIDAYVTSPQAGPPPGPPIFDETVSMDPTGRLYKRLVRVPKGSYYVVLDNTATAGRSSPPQAALDDRAVNVSAGIELGDAP
jgi:hypothetical protein